MMLIGSCLIVCFRTKGFIGLTKSTPSSDISDLSWVDGASTSALSNLQSNNKLTLTTTVGLLCFVYDSGSTNLEEVSCDEEMNFICQSREF